MNTQETTTTAIQSNDIEKILIPFQKYTGNESATFDDLFNFLTFPSGEREEFLQNHCTCNYLVQDSIVSPNYLAK